MGRPRAICGAALLLDVRGLGGLAVVIFAMLGDALRDHIKLVAQDPSHDHLKHRDEENSEEGREQHAADHTGADLMARE
jgi:hypothetical protein